MPQAKPILLSTAAAKVHTLQPLKTIKMEIRCMATNLELFRVWFLPGLKLINVMESCRWQPCWLRQFVRRIAGHLKLAPDTQLFKDMGIDVNVKVGDLVIQKDLARSLREIAEDGRAAFYEGRIAQQLIKGSEGWFNVEDIKKSFYSPNVLILLHYQRLIGFILALNQRRLALLIVMRFLVIPSSFK